jgi:hypothetical protein
LFRQEEHPDIDQEGIVPVNDFCQEVRLMLLRLLAEYQISDALTRYIGVESFHKLLRDIPVTNCFSDKKE